MMRPYNSWVSDLTSQYPDRLKWVTVIDPVDPQASVREIERERELGAVAVMLLGVTGDVRIEDPPMEPLWAAANDTGLPVAVHTGHSFRALGQVNDTHHDNGDIVLADRAVLRPPRDLEGDRRPLPELAHCVSRSRLLLGARVSGTDRGV